MNNLSGLSYQVFSICIALKIGKEEGTNLSFLSVLVFSQSYSRMKDPKMTSRSTEGFPVKIPKSQGKQKWGKWKNFRLPKYAKQVTYSKFCNINIANTCKNNIYGNLQLFHFNKYFILWSDLYICI